MGKIKIVFSPLFFIFILLFIYFGQGLLLLNYFAVLFMHEYSHAHMAKYLGYKINNIKLTPFGISLNMFQPIVLPKDEIKVALIGPLLNLFLGICCLALWWLYPIAYAYTYMFAYTNFAVAAFNLLPAHPLDGGRILLAGLNCKFSRKTSIWICRIANLTLGISFVIVFLLSLNFKFNITYLFAAVFILMGVFDSSKNAVYDYLQYKNMKFKTNKLKIKPLVVSDEIRLYKLTGFVNLNYFLQFVVLKEGRQIVAIFYETELEKLYEHYLPTTRLKDIKELTAAHFRGKIANFCA